MLPCNQQHKEGSFIIKAIGEPIHDTLNGAGDLDEKVVGR